MLAKQYRFHGHNSLRYVYTKGATARGRYISLKYVKNDRREASRLSVVVSKKITKLSPLRNRMRRRIYEVFRQQWSMILPGYDLVITIFDSRVGTIEADELRQIITEMIDSAGLRKG